MRKYSILYIDDEESNLRIFKDSFRKNYNIYIAVTAAEGKKILENNKIDLILSDQRMPEMTGVEFFQYTYEKYPNIKRILITGFVDIEAISNAINQAHIFQYVQKPWRQEALLKVMDNALELYQLEIDNVKQKKELIEAKEKAEESNKLKTEFINNLSHEIRTPMNGIFGFVKILSKPNISDEKKVNSIKIIQDCSNQLLNVIDDILEISKLETKQVEIHEEKTCLNYLLSQIYSIFEMEVEAKNISFNIKIPLSNEESNIIVDKLKLNKILNNLLENALKFTSKGFIEIGYKIINDKIELYVKDSGVGVSAENYKMIFKRFSQEEKELSRKTGGLGLGLSIAKENAELLEGEITLKSVKGEGATFFVTIPYKPVKLVKTSNDLTNMNIVASKNQIEHTVLIVEDDEVSYLYLNTLLVDAGLKLITLHAKNGKEAVDLCKSNTDIDLVLMDLNIPVISGFKATKLIKNNNPNITVIAQTAYVNEADKKTAILAGCSNVITKPIDEEILFGLIKEYLFK